MIQSVHNVIIGKQVPSTYTNIAALQAGDIAIFDQNRQLIKDSATAAAASAIYVGVCHGTVDVVNPTSGALEAKPNIEFSQEIQKAGKPSAVIGDYAAPTQQKIVITLTSATIVAGNRYVLRIVYKDLSDVKFQFTHSYEVYASSATAADLVTALAAKINAHKGRRVKAEASAAVLTLTALEKNDNEGVYSINEYSVVDMEAFLYTTIPGALLSNQPDSVPGATIAKTVGTPGKGYWKQVRDAEYRNMPYKGHVFTDAYPVIEQERMVVKDAEYDYAIIESDNLYLSNDNQYIKTTPMTVEVYCPSLVGSKAEPLIKDFISGVDSTAA